MAANWLWALEERNDFLDSAILDADVGKLIIYEDAVPATADAALIGGNTVLATFTLHATPSFTVVDDVATADVIADVLATHTGTATFFRLYKADGTTPVAQGTVGIATADLIMNSVDIVSGKYVSISAFTITAPK